MAGYLEAGNQDTHNREVLGPTTAGHGASGVVVYRGQTLASWGDPATPEMAFSVTKSFLSLVAGLAQDQGLLVLDRSVVEDVTLPEAGRVDPRITWRHLLTQTSGWSGVLWGKPTIVDAQSGRDPVGPSDAGPGAGWAYNDVRVNLLALALTVLHQRALPEVFAERIAEPIGMSSTWSWQGYGTHSVAEGGLPVVSGGAHWGGGLVISAEDLARVGELLRRGGRWSGTRVLSTEWIAASWSPCPVKPDYGLLWWRNDRRAVFPAAPATGRAARGNLGRHLLWIDPAHDLVIASHWGDDVEQLLTEVSNVLT